MATNQLPQFAEDKGFSQARQGIQQGSRPIPVTRELDSFQSLLWGGIFTLTTKFSSSEQLLFHDQLTKLSHIKYVSAKRTADWIFGISIMIFFCT
jgi:hypothetical protein